MKVAKSYDGCLEFDNGVTKKSPMSERTKSDITEQAEPLEFVQQDSENRILHLEQAVDNLKENFRILALGTPSQKELEDGLKRLSLNTVTRDDLENFYLKQLSESIKLTREVCIEHISIVRSILDEDISQLSKMSIFHSITLILTWISIIVLIITK